MKHKDDSPFMRAVWFSTYMVGMATILVGVIGGIGASAYGINAIGANVAFGIAPLVLFIWIGFVAAHLWIGFCVDKYSFYRERSVIEQYIDKLWGK